MSLTMTDGEICEMYRTAKDQKKQLGILADLNKTDKGTIAGILREGGYKVDGRWLAPRVRGETKKPASGEDAAPPPPSEELPCAPEDPPVWDDVSVGADIIRPPSPDGPEEDAPTVGALHEAPAVSAVPPSPAPCHPPYPVTVGDLWQILAELPQDALLLIDGLPIAEIRYSLRAAPGGWDEAVDLIGGIAHE